MLPLVLLLLAPSPDPEPADPKPLFACDFLTAKSHFVTEHRKTGVVWKVTSQSGIGRAEVRLKSGTAPETITIHLVGLKNLESFTFETGTVKLSAELGAAGTPVTWYDERGAPVRDPKKGVASLSMARTKEGVEVVLTTRKPGKRWRFAWIDYYRK